MSDHMVDHLVDQIAGEMADHVADPAVQQGPGPGSRPVLALTRLAGEPGRGDLLVVGAGLGTTSATLWASVADRLGERFEVIGVDLPGHGRSPAAAVPFTVADLAARLSEQVTALAGSMRSGRRAWYAGVSLAGAVAFELSRRAVSPSEPAAAQSTGRSAGPFAGLIAIAAASTIGEPATWQERAELVRRAGTPVLVSGSVQRWFAPGFAERSGPLLAAMLQDLCDTDDVSYALCCTALATYDARSPSDGTPAADAVPFLLVPGELDAVVTPQRAADDAARRPGVRLHVVQGCAHQPPAERPEELAAVITDFVDARRSTDER